MSAGSEDGDLLPNLFFWAVMDSDLVVFSHHLFRFVVCKLIVSLLFGSLDAAAWMDGWAHFEELIGFHQAVSKWRNYFGWCCFAAPGRTPKGFVFCQIG